MYLVAVELLNGSSAPLTLRVYAVSSRMLMPPDIIYYARHYDCGYDICCSSWVTQSVCCSSWITQSVCCPPDEVIWDAKPDDSSQLSGIYNIESRQKLSGQFMELQYDSVRVVHDTSGDITSLQLVERMHIKLGTYGSPCHVTS